MLNNTYEAWAEHCHKAGIDRDSPSGATPLPDDGSGEEYKRASCQYQTLARFPLSDMLTPITGCCLPTEKDRNNAVFVCRHGKIYPTPQHSETSNTTQQAENAQSRPSAKSKAPLEHREHL